MTKKRALYINTVSYGGAWKFMEELRAQNDHNSDVLTLGDVFLRIDLIRLLVLIKLVFNRLRFKILRVNERKTYIGRSESVLRTSYVVKLAREYQEVHIFRFANFLSIADLETISQLSNLSIYLVDESALFPRCSFRGDCDGFISHCNLCPFGKVTGSITRGTGTLYYIDPSHLDYLQYSILRGWELNKSFLLLRFRARISFHEAILSTQETIKLRPRLKVILASVNWSDRKGRSLLLKLIESDLLSSFDVTIVGKGLTTKVDSEGIRFIEALSLHELESKFLEADVFLSLSIFDTGPFTVNIAYYTGCIIVGTSVGIMKILNNEKDVVCFSEMGTDSVMEILERIDNNRNQYATYLSQRHE